jgi:hypothetical protein
MPYTVQVFLKNGNYSEEYALEKHNGEDSPENIRFEWEDEFRIKGVFSDVLVKRDDVFPIEGEMGEGQVFSFTLPHMMLMELQAPTGSVVLGFSEKAVESYVIDKEEQHIMVYLNDEEVIENPMPGLYVVLSDFPKELQG